MPFHDVGCISKQPVIGHLRVVRLLIEGNVKTNFQMVLTFLDPRDPDTFSKEDDTEYLLRLAEHRNTDTVKIRSIKECDELNSVARELFACLTDCEGTAKTNIDEALYSLESLIQAAWILKESIAAQTAQ